MTFAPVTPDLTGFDKAQDRKIDLLGSDVRFYGPNASVFPPGTAIDPETQLPYDPTIHATSVTTASGVLRCGVARVTSSVRALDNVTAIGVATENHVLLIITDTPQARAIALPAVRFVVGDQGYKVIDRSLDTPIRGHQRILVRGRSEP